MRRSKNDTTELPINWRDVRVVSTPAHSPGPLPQNRDLAVTAKLPVVR